MRFDPRFGFLLFTAWLAQAAVVPFFAVGKAQPDLILIVIAIYSFLEGPIVGGIAGFSGGLLQDLLLVRSVGLNIIAKTIVGYFSGLVERNLFGHSNLLPTLAIFVISIASQILYMAASFLVGERIEVWPAFISVILPSALYTSAVTFFIFGRITRLLSHERKETVFK